MADIRQTLTQLGLPIYAEGLATNLQGSGYTSNQISTEVNYRESLYKNLFKTMVGRDPNDNEMRAMYGQIAPNAALTTTTDKQTELQNLATQSIGTNFQQQAKDQAQYQLEQQQGKANDLSSLFRTQGEDAINKTQQSLLDYQSKLFDRLRPNLITSLNAQGLLNTGALNTAVAGAEGDLATAGSGALMDARLKNEQDANSIAFSGAAAPVQYATANITNQVPYMQGQATNAMDKGYNTFLTNLNYQNQLGLQNNAANIASNAQPSFLRTFGQTTAQSLGSNFNVPSWISAVRGGGAGSSGGRTA